MQQYVAIEGGGTKFVLAWGNGPQNLHDRIVIPTTSPDETFREVIAYLRMVEKKTMIHSVGAAIFGPLQLNSTYGSYGSITTTPKSSWKDFNVVQALKEVFDGPIGFDTDVNATALAEYRWGAGSNVEHMLYVTVGTGIGCGAIIQGKVLHGAMHPEMGHILVPHARQVDPYKGYCPYHGNCLEGLASGPAMGERWQVDCTELLAPEHAAWALEANYLGIGAANWTMILSPERIVMGGGVMRQRHLLPMVQRSFQDAMAGYIQNECVDHPAQYIVAAGLGENSGICGAMALAQAALEHQK